MEESIERGNNQSLHELGLLYFRENNYQTAKKYFILGSEKGNTESMNLLSMIFISEKNVRKASEFLQVNQFISIYYYYIITK